MLNCGVSMKSKKKNLIGRGGNGIEREKKRKSSGIGRENNGIGIEQSGVKN